MSPPLRLWRITTGPHPIWCGEGARRFGQRWNPPGLPAIYTGTSFALCLVEILVHANRRTPPSAARYVEAILPPDLSRETFPAENHPGWNDPHNIAIAQAYGAAWLRERRSCLLLAPSVVTAGLDTNIVVNPDHPEAARITIGPETPVHLAPRLFG